MLTDLYTYFIVLYEFVNPNLKTIYVNIIFSRWDTESEANLWFTNSRDLAFTEEMVSS